MYSSLDCGGFRVRTSQCRADGAFQLAIDVHAAANGPGEPEVAAVARRRRTGPSSMIITSAPGTAQLVLDRACQRLESHSELNCAAGPARGQREDEKAQATVSATCQCEPR